MTFNFNTTASVTTNETLQAAEVRIYKSGLTAEEISALEESCDLSKLSVQLYMKMHSNGGANDSVVLEQTVTLQKAKLEEEQYFVFSNMTQLYLRWNQESQNSNYLVSLRIAIAEPCTNLHPRDIGFASGEGKEPLIVGFSKSSGINFADALERQGIQNGRRKRQTAGITTSTTTPPDYNQHSCRLYRHNVSF